MNKIVALALRSVGLNRPVPTTRLGKALHRMESAGMALLALYVFLMVRPQILFAHSVTTQGITLYSRAPLPPEAATCVARAAALVRQSELAVASRSERVFICDSPWLFSLFSPTSGRAFAFSVPLTDNVFIAAADCLRDEARSSAPRHNIRSLSSVIAHEITHGLIRHHLGLLRGVRLPGWVAEGYCDYVARESSFPETEGRRLMTAGQTDLSASFWYFRDRQMVRYLIDTKHGTFSDVVARANDADAVEAETIRALRTGVTSEPTPLP